MDSGGLHEPNHALDKAATAVGGWEELMPAGMYLLSLYIRELGYSELRVHTHPPTHELVDRVLAHLVRCAGPEPA